MAAMVASGCDGDPATGSDSQATASSSAGDPTSADPTSGGGSSGGEGSTTGVAGYHPAGFADPEVHGMALKLQGEDCRNCHGEELDGGTVQVSCDECHTPQWRTDCTYCHGGTNDQSGAPPRDLNGETQRALLSFIAHDRHVSEYEHAAYDCTECHTKPADVLSVGHIFDDTPAQAEVDFSLGLSAEGSYDYAGGCSQIYCHSSGQSSAVGQATDSMEAPDCGGCHPSTGTTNLAFTLLSGRHAFHLGRGFQCQECHDPTAVTTHVNGQADVSFAAAGFNYTSASHSCEGTCHGATHFGQQWM
jgi:predicted CxxxxCH...CXXCH cytochrome family protein